MALDMGGFPATNVITTELLNRLDRIDFEHWRVRVDTIGTAPGSSTSLIGIGDTDLTTGTATTWTLSSGTLLGRLNGLLQNNNTGTTNATASRASGRVMGFIDGSFKNSAIKCVIRWGHYGTFNNSGQRSYFGLYPSASSAPGVPIGSLEPLTSFINVVGVGASSGDTNLSFIWNDGTAAPSAVDLGSEFPKSGTADKVYELTIQVVQRPLKQRPPISWSMFCVDSGAFVSGSVWNDLPDTSIFVYPLRWVSTGTGTAQTGFLDMQTVVKTRF
jgi:hypothetical protein